jgi:hypothetical protein
MRALVVVIITVAVAAGVLKHRNRVKSDAPAQPAVRAEQQAAASGEPSQHHWPKRALDRAADVKRQVHEQRKQHGAP